MPSLGLIMILRNEAENLARSLKPVAGLFDEVVAVDTGSEDKTSKIAESMGASIYDFKWNDDFSAARNFSISKAESDYLFWLDGDNALSQSSVAVIRKALESRTREFIGWCREVLEPRGGSLIQKRLFPNRADVFFSGRIHEQLRHPERFQFVHLEVDIRHWGYRNPREAKAKGERNLRILYESLKSNRDDFYLLYQIGKTLLNLKDYDEAKAYLERAATSGEGGTENPELAAHALILQGIVLERLGDSKGLAVFEKAIRSGPPGRRLGYFHLGRILAEKGEREAAVGNLEHFLAEPTSYLTLDVDLDRMTFQALVLLGRLYRHSGQMDKSASFLSRAVEMEPGNPFPYRELIKTLLAGGRVGKAREIIDRLAEINPGDRFIEQTRDSLSLEAQLGK